jgi:hypothetical protein
VWIWSILLIKGLLLFFLLPMCVHQVPNNSPSSHCVPQYFPTNAILLSHMFCPKLSSFRLSYRQGKEGAFHLLVKTSILWSLQRWNKCRRNVIERRPSSMHWFGIWGWYMLLWLLSTTSIITNLGAQISNVNNLNLDALFLFHLSSNVW